MKAKQTRGMYQPAIVVGLFASVKPRWLLGTWAFAHTRKKDDSHLYYSHCIYQVCVFCWFVVAWYRFTSVWLHSQRTIVLRMVYCQWISRKSISRKRKKADNRATTNQITWVWLLYGIYIYILWFRPTTPHFVHWPFKYEAVTFWYIINMIYTFWHIEAEIKLPPFHRQHFQRHFLKSNCLNSD